MNNRQKRDCSGICLLDGFRFFCCNPKRPPNKYPVVSMSIRTKRRLARQNLAILPISDDWRDNSSHPPSPLDLAGKKINHSCFKKTKKSRAARDFSPTTQPFSLVVFFTAPLLSPRVFPGLQGDLSSSSTGSVRLSQNNPSHLSLSCTTCFCTNRQGKSARRKC